MGEPVRDILTENVPAWYELGWVRDHLVIEVHPGAFRHLAEVIGNSRLDLYHKSEDLGLSHFNGPERLPWGFGDVLKRTISTRRDGWLQFDCEYPRIVGPQAPPDMQKGYDISATLGTVFEALDCYGKATQSRVPQLFTLYLATHQGLCGGAMVVQLSRPVVRWLADNAHLYPVVRQHCESAMQDAHELLYHHIEDRARVEFECILRMPGFVSINYRCGTCGLGPEDPTRIQAQPHNGYRLLASNMDGPLDQLVILAGLAAVGRFIRNNP